MSRSLVATFAGLKVRLLRNRARSTRNGTLQLAVSVLAGAFGVLALAPAAYGILRTSNPTVAGNVAVIGATVLVVGWAVLPLLTFGSDETVDPAKLVLFPLRGRQLMAGMAVASLIGPAPIAATAVVAAGGLGYRRGPAGAFVLPVVVLLVLLAVTAARTLSTLLAAALTSRRGRDLSIVLGAVFLLALQGIRFVDTSAFSGEVADRVAGFLRWLPPGMLARALDDAGGGRTGLAVVELLPAAATVAVLALLWGRALDRSMTDGGQGETAPGARRDPTEPLPLLFRRLPFLRANPWGAVAAKELRYANRDPRRKVAVVNAILLGTALPIFFAVRSGGIRPDSVMVATLAGYMVVLQSLNQFGFDRGALWIDVVAGDVARDELIGKNLATGTVVAFPLLVVAVSLAAAGGGWAYLPAALLITVAGMGAGLAVANVASVRYPVRLPESRSPFGGGGGGQGCATGFIVWLCILAQNVAIAPVALATVVAVRVAPASLVVVAPACAVYGMVLWWAGLTVATSYARDHQPELLQAVDPARSDLAT